MNVDKNPAYPAAVEALKADGIIPQRVPLRQCKYLNNVIEQDHRTVKKRVWLASGYGSFQSAWRTLPGAFHQRVVRTRDLIQIHSQTASYWLESLNPGTSQRNRRANASERGSARPRQLRTVRFSRMRAVHLATSSTYPH
jgi:hypothetical protein